MYLEELFDKRDVFADKLRICMKNQGYTKVSLARKADISRPTLDRILKGEVENKTTFTKHAQKLLTALQMQVDDVLYAADRCGEQADTAAVYSSNEPNGYSVSERGQKQMELLRDILGICEIYY